MGNRLGNPRTHRGIQPTQGDQCIVLDVEPNGLAAWIPPKQRCSFQFENSSSRYQPVRNSALVLMVAKRPSIAWGSPRPSAATG